MNRFDNGSVSAYTPQSMQELAFTPMMKRTQHDEMSKNLAALDAIAADPLDVHQKEALRIKQEFEGKLGNLSGSLAEKGIDGVGKSDFYKLKKEHDDLIAPTGRIGEINAAKILYNKRQEDYIKSAEKENIGRDQALINWKNANKDYTGFDESNGIKNVDELGANQYQDYDKQLSLKHSLLGETIRGFSNSGHHLEKGADGSYWEVTKNGNRIKSTNALQVDAAQKAFEDSWLNGEGAKWSKEAGLNITKDRINNDFKSMLKNSNVYKEDVSANYHEPSSTENNGNPYGNDGLFGETYNVKEIGGANFKGTDELGLIGKLIPDESIAPTVDASGAPIVQYRKFTSDDIKDPAVKALYKKRFKDIQKGIFIDGNGKQIKLKDKFSKIDENDNAIAKYIVDSFKTNPLTLSSKMMTANQMVNDKGFAASLGPDATKVDSNFARQLERGTSGRKLIDPETGKSITYAEAKDKYNLDNLSTLHYQGYISPFNWEEDGHKGTNSKFSPHIITITDTKGNPVEFKTSRLDSDNYGLNPTRQNELTKNYRKTTLDHDNWQDFESSSENLKSIKSRYISKPNRVEEETGQPIVFEVDFGKKGIIGMSEGTYMNFLNSTR